MAILFRGPNYTIRRILDKERFQLEMEKVFVKLRWALRDKGLMDEVDMETLMTEEEKKRIAELVELIEIKTRSVFNHDKKEVDFRNSRATDVKHNSKVILPGPLTVAQEGEMQMRRIAWGAVFDQFIAEFKDEKGVRDDNLTKEEAAGLKSLKKRMSEGSLVVVQTDKSSRFAIMSLEEYEEAGRKHTSNDQEVDLEFVKQNETNINGHMSMLMKIFVVGAAWGHEDRTRATACP